GVLFYIIALGISSLEQVSEVIKKGMKADLVSRLAYEDGLTGIGNRTAYRERIDSIAAESDSHTVFLFDINNLKYVNDNIGHAAGDKLIISASEVITKVFSGKGKCYRIGGDEFVCVCDAEYDIEETDKIFTEEIERYNREENTGFPLVIAYGAYVCRGSEDIHGAIETADKRMYECKTSLKEKYPLDMIIRQYNESEKGRE
ncbi:MAG: GGDEF domain-containing protein, partial [Ruminococcus sp.]|nr:GGDEF domain-containing protein [Ruminococcus sp.]